MLFIWKSFGLTFLISLTGTLCLPDLSATDKEKDTEIFLHRFLLNVEDGKVESKQLAEIKKLAKAKDEKISNRALGLLAWYEGECGDIKSALLQLAPSLLDKKDAEDLDKLLSSPKKGGDIQNVLSQIPPASRWRTDNPELCVCFARLLAAGKRHSEAIDGFNLIGANFSGVPRALAAEGIADMQFQLKDWQKCIENYTLALQCLDWLKKQSEYQNDPDKIIEAFGNRIKRKLDETQLAWDAERYGPGFVAYRKARIADFAKDYAKAVVLYDRLARNFPDSVYGEAAGVYGSKCLVNLSTNEEKARVEKAIKETELKITKNNQTLRKYDKTMALRIRERHEKLITEEKSLLDEIKKLPLGKKAESVALDQMETFVTTDPRGLYRGECLQFLGDWYLEEKLDVETAFKYYSRCFNWIEEIGKMQNILAAFQVPEQASSITAPPPSEKKLTGWSQWIEKNQIKPEQIINRIHCPWYLDSLRAHNGKMLSLCYFINGERERAVEAAKAIVKYEPLERMMFEQKQPNSYQRLIEGYGRGWFYCPQEEINLFKAQHRTAILLGDFYFALEEEDKCERVRKALAEESLGKLSKQQQATADLLLAEIVFRKSGNIMDAAAILKRFEDGDYQTTTAHASAMLGLGNIYYQKANQEGNLDKAITCYEKAVKASSGAIKETALFYLANAYRRSRRYKDAIKSYNSLLKQNPQSIHYGDLCRKYIELSRQSLGEIQ